MKATCAWIAAAVLAAGCGSSPTERFYTLAAAPRNGAPPDPPAGPAAPRDTGSIVSVGPVAVPALVDRPQFVVRTGAQRVDVLEAQRWAQPLPREIGAAVAAGLEGALPGLHAFAGAGELPPPAEGGPAALRLTLRVERFDAWLGDDPRVADEIFWLLRCEDGTGEPGVVRSGFLQMAEPASPGSGGGPYAELAAAHARVLARLSRAAAAAIEEVGSACRTAPGAARR